MKIYLSGALQASRDLSAARRLYAYAAEVLRAEGHDVYLPHQNTDPENAPHATASEVFNRDLEQMRGADLIVAFLNEPSLGVGAELALAIEHRIEIVALAENRQAVSRFMRGLLDAAEAPLQEYSSMQDLACALRRIERPSHTPLSGAEVPN